jgi:RimJ/RimL family protein N-acetyltransferase
MKQVIPAQPPRRTVLEGRLVRVAPLDAAAHSAVIYAGTHGEDADARWAWMPDGPFPDLPAFEAQMARKQKSEDPLYFALVERASGMPGGYASYLRITPAHGVIEVGDIMYTRSFQRTAAATEAMYLMARHAFEDLGYRRYEWKCNALNEPSRRAALRLGFTFEAIFRQHMIVKGKNRDTAWFAMLDSEWPLRKHSFERWLEIQLRCGGAAEGAACEPPPSLTARRKRRLRWYE